MKKKAIIVLLVFIGVAVFLFLFVGKGKKAWEGNILVVTLDTTRADSIGCYGETRVRTPNLDRLGESGIRFENCYSPVPLTLPAHCTIFTGRYPLGHGVRNNGTFYLSEKERTMGEIFQQNGYHSYAVIAAFVLLAKFGLKQGFDVYDDSLDTHKLVNTFKSEIRAVEVYQKFESWFKKNRTGKLFAWIHFYDPHTPYQPPKGYFKKEDIKDKFALYRGEISFMDVYVGKVLDLLEREKILKNTLVVVVGDHGEAFGEHEEYAGHSIFCYEENIRVPFIFYNPQLFKKPLVIKERVNTADIMPTLLELAGLERFADLQGRSLVPLFKGKNLTGESAIYVESMFGREEMGWAPLTGIIADGYKFISLPEPELYWLENDPGEKKNLFRIKANVSRKLDKKLAEMVVRYSRQAGDSKRDLTRQDVQHLKSLGYISAFSSRTEKGVDPKKGILFNNRVKKISTEISRGNLDSAEREINRIMKENPEMINYALITQLFKIHMNRNHIEKALEALRDGIRRFPDLVAFRTLFCQMLYDLKKYEEVIRESDQILKIDSSCTWAYILLGDSYDDTSRPEQALDNYRKALELEPENVSLKIKVGELLLKNNRLPDALRVYNEVLENPDVWSTPRTLYKIALFNASQGTLDKAEELMSRIIQLEPGGKYYYMYALILARNRKLPQALRNMEIAVNQYNDQLSPLEKDKAGQAIRLWKQAF